jgi:hypothetical protein
MSKIIKKSRSFVLYTSLNLFFLSMGLLNKIKVMVKNFLSSRANQVDTKFEQIPQNKKRFIF